MSQEDVLHTLQWGIEGENYTVDENGNEIYEEPFEFPW